MRRFVFGASAVALFVMPHLASAQEGTAAGVAKGAATGATIGTGVGGPVGGAEKNAKELPAQDVAVVPDVTTTGSIRQRTCSVDIRGNQSCSEIVR